ncbi:cytochrome P450 [Streptomyces sp. GD-15H]|uniref:cytochrome P450 n=1 Tax=Streptomyces sp. GD-15H TaxID=3129112 RepID=UPI00324A2BC7
MKFRRILPSLNTGAEGVSDGTVPLLVGSAGMTRENDERLNKVSNTLIESPVPTVDLDFYDPDFVNDPYPALEAVRAVGPIVQHAKLGHYLITSYRDCARAMGQGRLFTSDHEQIGKLFGGPPFTALEGKRHADVRGIWARDFRRKNIDEISGMIAGIVAEATQDAFDRMRDGEVVDIVPAVTRPIPTLVIATLMGIPTENIAEFIRWTDNMTGIMEGRDDPTPRGQRLVEVGVESTNLMNAFVATIIEERRRNPGQGDLVSKMVESDVPMTEAEQVSWNTQLIFAGNETTSKLMGSCLAVLAQHPEQRAQLREDRALIPQAIEEVHRYNSVKMWNMRFVRDKDVELAGHVVPAGASVMALQGLGNRDPERWENPDVFDIHRPVQAHLGFGIGAHVCLGNNLARFEIETVLNRFLDEVPDWELHDVNYGLNAMIRGPVKMDVSAAR